LNKSAIACWGSARIKHRGAHSEPNGYQIYTMIYLFS
jgi:hypothetical protein